MNLARSGISVHSAHPKMVFPGVPDTILYQALKLVHMH